LFDTGGVRTGGDFVTIGGARDATEHLGVSGVAFGHAEVSPSATTESGVDDVFVVVV
jgi:hypothetical protein